MMAAATLDRASVEVHIKAFEACTILTCGSVDVGSFTPERLADGEIYKNARKITDPYEAIGRIDEMADIKKPASFF